MGSTPPIKTACFIKFLIYQNCTEGTGTKHNKWKCPGCMRAIMFDRNKKEIPYMHVHTNVQNMGIAMKDFKAWAKNNC